jgi:hypothetical protein
VRVVAEVPHTDFSVPAGVVAVQLGRGLMWSDPTMVAVRPGEVTSVYFSLSALRPAD